MVADTGLTGSGCGLIFDTAALVSYSCLVTRATQKPRDPEGFVAYAGLEHVFGCVLNIQHAQFWVLKPVALPFTSLRHIVLRLGN